MPEPDADLAARTLDTYARVAARFDRERSRELVELPWLERWLGGLPAEADLLDLGCGSGEPIARYLLGQGHRVSGVDGAASLLELARTRLPAGRWIHADMRTLTLDRSYDGILGWDSVFHLTADEQRTLLPRLAAALAPGGALLLSVGPAAGTAIGQVGGEAVHHASLDPEEYRTLLAHGGLQLETFVAEDPTCGGRSLLLARRP